MSKFCRKIWRIKLKLLASITVIGVLVCLLSYGDFQFQNVIELQYLLENRLDIFILDEEKDLEIKRHSFFVQPDEYANERACKIPRINPYESIALKLIRAQTLRKRLQPLTVTCRIQVMPCIPWSSRQLQPPHCLSNPSFKFVSDHDSKIIKVRENRTKQFWRNTKFCCYVPFTTDENYNRIIKLSSCIKITEEETLIPNEYSNINILCYNHEELTYRDYFHFFRLDPKIEKNLQEKEAFTQRDGSDHLSILFLGLDSVSLTNFQRFLPNTRNYLVQNMSVLEFIGLNKVGRGTMENIVPALTGCPYIDGETKFPSPAEDCYLIWEKFKEQGYRTALSEEQFWFTAYKQIKHKGNGKHNMDYTNLPFVKGIQNNLYYHHLWSVLTTHEVIEYAKYLDDPYYRLMKTLYEKQHLNNTLLIVYSDHGTVSSDYSRTPEGLIEARQPLLYMVFPEWFKTKYSMAIKYLKLNTQALISPFDLYQTLAELLDLKQISNDGFHHLQNQNAQEAKLFGISLFRQIPFNRTCKSGHIPEEYCICWSWTQLDNPNKDINVVKAVSFTLDIMNSIIDGYSECIRLDLEKIIDGKKSLDSWGNVVYEIIFQVIPSHGIFGAVLKVVKVTSDGQIVFRILGEIERQNRYGDQSKCLSKELLESGWLRSACFCRK